MTLSKRKDTVNRNSEHWIEHCGELALEEVMDWPVVGQITEWMFVNWTEPGPKIRFPNMPSGGVKQIVNMALNS